jgi:hypothetical protein
MFIKLLTCLLLISFTNIFSANEVEIIVSGDRSNSNVIEDIVRKNLVDRSEIKLLRVSVKVTNHSNGKTLSVILVGSESYYFESVRIELSHKNEVLLIIRNICPFEARTVTSICPDDELDILYTTPESSKEQAVTAVKLGCKVAREHGYKCKTLIGIQATSQNIKNYLTCKDLKVFGNIGYGNECSMLFASKSTISNRWFEEIISNSIDDLTLLLNSSQVHNDPLKSSILKLGVKSFIGGAGTLKIGASEKVFICITRNLFKKAMKIKNIVENCIDSEESAYGGYEVSGKGEYFNEFTPIPLEPLPPNQAPVAKPFHRPWTNDRFLE